MISKKDFKRFSDQFDEAFDNLATAMESIHNKPFMMQLYDVTGDKYGKGVFVECYATSYSLDTYLVEVGFRDPLNDNRVDVRYLLISEIAEKGEW
ncbi:hypothetical protein [Bacillus phage SWEP1]|nr:hypothetical protein [Bacillus phage SWEP1]